MKVNFEETCEVTEDYPRERELKDKKKHVDYERLAFIVLLIVMFIISVLSVIGYVLNWQSVIMVYSIGMGTFYALGSFIGIIFLVFLWNN